jgi:uncharacterized membrane protein
MSVQQRKRPSEAQDIQETQEDAIAPPLKAIRHRPVTRSHIQKSLVSAVVFGIVLSVLACFVIERRDGFPHSSSLLAIYILVFGFPTIFTFLSGWATQYRRLSFLTGALFGLVYLCGIITVRYFQTGTIYSHEFWLYILPLTIGGAFFASLGASIRWHVEHPKAARKIEKK